MLSMAAQQAEASRLYTVRWRKALRAQIDEVKQDLRDSMELLRESRGESPFVSSVLVLRDELIAQEEALQTVLTMSYTLTRQPEPAPPIPTDVLLARLRAERQGIIIDDDTDTDTDTDDDL